MKKWSDRTLIQLSVVMSALAIVLSLLHPFFAVLASPLSAVVSYYIFNAVSRIVFGKEFQPPSKSESEWDATRRWSDWLLVLPFVLVFVSGLFAFGEVADCMHHRNMWKSGWSLCTPRRRITAAPPWSVKSLLSQRCVDHR